MSNPYRHVYAREAAQRRAGLGWSGWLGSVLSPLLVAVLLTPLLQPVFLGWTSLGPERWAEGTSAFAIRLSLLVLSLLSLDAYDAVLRSPDRDVLAVLPVRPAPVVWASVERVARRRWWCVPFSAILMSPIAVAGAGLEFALAVWMVACSFALGLTVAAWVFLLAVRAAEDPRVQPLLDMIRGPNPRESAAFIYAPGLVILLAGGAVSCGVWGLEVVASAARGLGEGGVLGGVALLVPLLPVGLAALRLGSEARRTWFRASLVLAEVDARYAAMAKPEEALHVYLDWTLRILPSRVARYALMDLRHGWRSRRSWISLTWLVAIGAVAAGWASSDDAWLRASIVLIGGGLLSATLGVLRERDEPELLSVWLGGDRVARALARLWVIGIWLQPATWLAAMAVSLRHGGVLGVHVWVVGQGVAWGGGALVLICVRMGRLSIPGYAALASLLGAAVIGALS